MRKRGAFGKCKRFSLSIKLFYPIFQLSRGSARKYNLRSRLIKTGSMYHGFYTLRGESFRMGTFGRPVFCEVKTQIVGKTLVFRQAQTQTFLCAVYSFGGEKNR